MPVVLTQAADRNPEQPPGIVVGEPVEGHPRRYTSQRLLHGAIDAQRAALVRMRNEGSISADVMRRVEHDLDLEESRLEVGADSLSGLPRSGAWGLPSCGRTRAWTGEVIWEGTSNARTALVALV